MSRPVRARGLKRFNGKLPSKGELSRPVRARGLKLVLTADVTAVKASRPVRARGLKQKGIGVGRELNDVAPRAGAWIETLNFQAIPFLSPCRAPCGCVD